MDVFSSELRPIELYVLLNSQLEDYYYCYYCCYYYYYDCYYYYHYHCYYYYYYFVVRPFIPGTLPYHSGFQVSDCSTFHAVCNVTCIAVFCDESVECLLGMASKFFLLLFRWLQ
jgi:hypothetical protein